MEERMGDGHQTNEKRKGDGQVSTRSHVGLRDIHHLCTDLAAAEITKRCIGLKISRACSPANKNEGQEHMCEIEAIAKRRTPAKMIPPLQ